MKFLQIVAQVRSDSPLLPPHRDPRGLAAKTTIADISGYNNDAGNSNLILQTPRCHF
jgi:hypothetical protein